MKAVSSPAGLFDRVLGGLVVCASLALALLMAGLNGGGAFSPAAVLFTLPFAAPGLVAGIGIYVGTKWGYCVAVVFSLLSMFPIPISFVLDDGKPLQAIISAVPALVVLVLCSIRLSGKLGPPLR